MYLALYRKYRPQTFDDVISQEHITITLKNQLKNGQTAHAYLFTGSRGTGKTTCAKILAKAINCLNPVDGNPCMECESCRAIDEGATDITEIDAASNNGVDNIRELKEEAMYTPISCHCRVYIIDEVHMLSVSAFNALLKLIEEPPPHVVFIFATTEIHKVPATILSRCQRFEFRRIDINDSKKRLLEIAEKENMQLDENAAYLISRISEGGMRDALSLLDQCFSVSRNVTEDVVRSCAGISGTEHLVKIADAVLDKNAAAALSVLEELVRRSKSPSRLIEELISHYRTLMLLKAGADRDSLRITETEQQDYLRQNSRYTLEMILRALTILSDTLTGMSRAKNEALFCEMCLIKLCTPKLDVGEAALSGRIDALEKLVNDALSQLKSGAPITAPSYSEEAAPKPMENSFREEEYIHPPNPEPPVSMPIDLPFDIDGQPSEPPPPPFTSEPMSLNEALGIAAENNAPPPVPEPIPPEPEPLAAGTVSLNEALGLSARENPPEAEHPKKSPAKIKEVSDGFEPFIEWSEIIAGMPFYKKVLIDKTTAMISGNVVQVSGPQFQRDMVVGEFSEDVRSAVSRAIGRNVILQASDEKKSAPDESKTKVKDFLDFARSQGVTIKEQ